VTTIHVQITILLVSHQKKNGYQRCDYKGGLLYLILNFPNLITYLDDPEEGLVDKLRRWKLSRSSTAESYWVSNGWCIGGGLGHNKPHTGGRQPPWGMGWMGVDRYPKQFSLGICLFLG
jgi:hypothetical protein